MDEVKAVEQEERKLLERLLALQKKKTNLREYGDELFRRGMKDYEAEVPPPDPISAVNSSLPSEGIGATNWLSSFDVDWANLDPNLLAQAGQDFVGGTAGASPGSSGTQTAPTS
jgi:hypothetical protein